VKRARHQTRHLTRDGGEGEHEIIDLGYATVPLHVFNDGHTVKISNTTPAAIDAAGDTWKAHPARFSQPERALDPRAAK
jgi:hypothetical protein